MAAKSESIANFVRRISGQENLEEARTWIENSVLERNARRRAMEHMGTVTIIVMPGGSFGFHLSENLTRTRGGLDSVDRALDDVREFVQQVRSQVIDKEIMTRAQNIVNQQEESDGSNSIDSPGHSKDGS